MICSAPTLADWGELRLLRWVRRAAGWDGPKSAAPGSSIELAIGDDAAILRLGSSGRAIVTTDALVENVHFRRDWIAPRDLGAKALAVNLSDLAAMAAEPVAAFLSLGVPPSASIADIQSFFRGLIAEGRRHGCPLAGGDLVRAPIWMINIMAVGRPGTGGRVALRSTAQPGQGLYVTGRPGESGAGLEALRRGERAGPLVRRHNRPTPRLKEALALAAACPDLAMIDVSDGLWSESRHLAEESGVRVEIELARLPHSPALRRFAREAGVAPERWALFGGEDYELLFTTERPAEEIREAFERGGIRTPVRRIGRVRKAGGKGSGVCLMDAEGRAVPEGEIEDFTFRHFEE